MISFESVTFAYGERDAPVLRDVDLRIDESYIPDMNQRLMLYRSVAAHLYALGAINFSDTRQKLCGNRLRNQ